MEAVHRNVDLVDLLSASTVMRAQVVSTGILLVDADPGARAIFETTVYASYARLNEERRALLDDIKQRGHVYG